MIINQMYIKQKVCKKRKLNMYFTQVACFYNVKISFGIYQKCIKIELPIKHGITEKNLKKK